MDSKPLTRARSKLIDASALIYGEQATAKDAAFIARELIQATLPHKSPGNVPVWTRTNGNVSLIMQQGYDRTGKPYGYPFGTVPRLLLFWMTTEALRNKGKEDPRRLELGHSLTDFMRELGLNPDNGSRGAKRGDARRLTEQMTRLFNATISFETESSNDGGSLVARRNMMVADDLMFWWDKRAPQQTTIWGSYIKLSPRFYDAITAAPVPVDVRALRALKNSALALDLYSWLTYEAYRAHKSGKPRFETWAQLQAHLGGEYAHVQHFRAKVKAALLKIKAVYPSLKLGDRAGGIQVLPESLPALQPRPVITIDAKARPLPEQGG
jgi:hypothetical protein